MDRREALENTSWLIGTGILAPSILAFLQGCQNTDISENGKPVALSVSQFSLLGVLSDIIIPGTESASATAAKVPEFIDLLIADILDSDVSHGVREGLNEIDTLCRTMHNQPFVDLSDEQQITFIQKLDNEAFDLSEDTEYDESLLAKYKSIKGLVLMAYYTSEKGVTENLDYAPVPGAYQSCIDLPEDQRITVGNHM